MRGLSIRRSRSRSRIHHSSSVRRRAEPVRSVSFRGAGAVGQPHIAELYGAAARGRSRRRQRQRGTHPPRWRTTCSTTTIRAAYTPWTVHRHTFQARAMTMRRAASSTSPRSSLRTRRRLRSPAMTPRLRPRIFHLLRTPAKFKSTTTRCMFPRGQFGGIWFQPRFHRHPWFAGVDKPV